MWQNINLNIKLRAGKPGPWRGRPVKSFEWVLNKADINFKNMVWKCWLKNVIGRNTSFCHLPACWSTYFWQKKSLGIFHEVGCLQNEKSFPFQALEAPQLWKSLTFVKIGIWIVFTKRAYEKWVKFAFSSCWSFRAFKISNFCQKRCLSRFSPSGKLTKWTKFVFSRKIFIKLFLGD